MSDPALFADVRRRVVTNTAAQLVAPALRVGASVVVFAVLGRYLGVAGFGEYGLVVAYVVLFTNALGDWGLATILLREIARRPAEREALISSAAALQLVLAALSYAAVLGIALFSAYSADVRWSLAVFGLTLLLAPVQMLSAHFATDLRLTRLVAPPVAGTVAQLVLVLVAVGLGGPLVAIVAAGAVSVAIEHLWSARIVLRELRLERPSTAPWGPFFREAWPIAGSTALATAAKQAPLLVLSGAGLDAVGIFTAATKIPDYLTRIPYALRTSLFPLFARRWHERAAFGGLVDRGAAGTLALTAPVAVVGIALAPQVVTIVFGRAFEDAALPFAVLMAGFVLASLGVVLEAALVAADGQRANLAIRGATSLLLLGLLAVLARPFGPTGSALAVAGSAAATAAVTLAVTRSRAARTRA